MRTHDWLQLLLFLGTLFALTPLLGAFMHRVFSGERNWLSPLLVPVERLIYKLAGVDPQREMRWTIYAGALLSFNLLGIVALLGDANDAGVAAAQSAEARECAVRARAKYRGFLCHEHQLAGLFGRGDDELLHPDGRARGAEFRQRGDRDCGRDRPGPWADRRSCGHR